MIENHLEKLANILHLRYPIKEISEKTGFSQATVSRFYNNKLKISRNFIRKVEEVYDIDYNKLVNIIENKIEESPAVYAAQTPDFERQKILELLNKLKTDAENYLQELEKKPVTTQILEEKAKILEILQKTIQDINLYKK